MASIKEQVERIVAKKAKLANGRTIEQTLMEAVDYLYECVQTEIDLMYESYAPKVYERRPYHESLRSALYAEDFLDARIKGNRIEVSLKFSNNVWAWNFNGDHKSNVAVLMLKGWKWKNYDGEEDRFRRFNGYDFIGKGVREFSAHNKWGVKVVWGVNTSNWY
jgi:hypothetical protein